MRKKIVKIASFVAIIVITFVYTIKWLDTINIKIDESLLNELLVSSSNLSKENKIINKIVTSITTSSYLNPVNVIKRNYYLEGSNESNNKPNTSFTWIDNNNEQEANNKDPIVYIYNTHQTEKYAKEEAININYSVLDSSFLLKEKLKSYNIESVVETGGISDVLNSNNWNYAQSYRVSRMYLEKAKENYPTLKYYIDLHRDSVSKKISTVIINNKSYARTMFLLGLENSNYKENQKTLEELEGWLNNNYPGLSRGIYKKEGKGVNGVYNQDFSSNCILIEVGGEENTKEEVENTIEVIAKMVNYFSNKRV